MTSPVFISTGSWQAQSDSGFTVRIEEFGVSYEQGPTRVLIPYDWSTIPKHIILYPDVFGREGLDELDPGLKQEIFDKVNAGLLHIGFQADYFYGY